MTVIRYYVLIDAHTLELPAGFGESDDQVRQALTPFYPEFSGAPLVRMRRGSTETISIIRRVERRHTHQVINMLEDLSAVHMDLAVELKLFARRMGYLIERLQNGSAFAAEMALYFQEFITYAAARMGAAENIIQSGRPGPYSYIPPVAKRPDRPGVGRINR